MGLFGPTIQSNINSMSKALGRDPFNVTTTGGSSVNLNDAGSQLTSLQHDYAAKQASDAAAARQARIDNDPSVVQAREVAKQQSDAAAAQQVQTQQSMADSAVAQVNAANTRTNTLATAAVQSDASVNATATPDASVDTASSDVGAGDPRRKYSRQAAASASTQASASRGGAGISIA